MKCKFVVGQKVTPIEAWSSIGPGRDIAFPQMGVTYTIRIIELIDGEVGLSLVELQNPPRQYSSGYREALFAAIAFRPVDERKTDISIFTELLTPAGQKKRILEDAHV